LWDAYAGRARAEYLTNNPRDALADYHETIKLARGQARRYWRTGLSNLAALNLRGWTRGYSLSKQMEVKIAAFYYEAGLIRNQLRDPDGAIREFNEALQISPNFVAADVDRGNARKDKGDLDAALADYDHAIQINPNFVAAYVDRGLAKMQKKRSRRGVE
jgi:tetratricopeptide (TPR) repeat protein